MGAPVTQALRAIPLFLLVALAWRYEPVRYWVAACGATLVIGLVMTRALVRTWIIADRVRFAIMTGGYLCLLRAFSLPLG